MTTTQEIWTWRDLDAAISRIEELDGALKQIHMHLSNHIETHKKVDVAVAVAFDTARAALEHQP